MSVIPSLLEMPVSGLTARSVAGATTWVTLIEKWRCRATVELETVSMIVCGPGVA